MAPPTTLRVYLEAPMLKTAREGSFNFLNVLKRAVEEAGWRLEWHETGEQARARAPDLDGYALFHLEVPTHERALTFRRTYHYPFWQIEPNQQRWRFEVAHSAFDPGSIDPEVAHHFVRRLRERVLPGVTASRGPTVLVPLQSRILVCRGFQTMSPVEMVEEVARTGRPVAMTLHPTLEYDADDREALDSLLKRYPNLTLAPSTPPVLSDCNFIATQNSAVAFDGYILGKPAVLFAQTDIHHIALNVADLGAAEALQQAPGHAPDFERYLYWFLQEKAINATLPDAGERIRAAMRRGGWPI